MAKLNMRVVRLIQAERRKKENMKPEPYDQLRDDRAKFTDEERLERAIRLGLHTKQSWPDDTLSALIALCDAGLYVLRSDWDGRTVKGADETLQRAHDSIQADEKSNCPGPGDPACRECGDPAEYPSEFPQYCQQCWNGQLRRRSRLKHQ